MKQCRICKEWKENVEFGQFIRPQDPESDGLNNNCKVCAARLNREWASRHRAKLKKKNSEYYSRTKKQLEEYYLNRDRICENKRRKWRENIETNRAIAREKKRREYSLNREKILERSKAWHREHREYYQALRQRPKIKVTTNMSRAIRQSIKQGKSGRRWEHILGYSLSELMTHLESLFKLGMSWENYPTWEIDHVKPISAFQFDSCDDPEFHQCWALSNLQPLWKAENRSKNSKYTEIS